MGLLDFLSSPEAQLGIGLLSAGGPTTDPNKAGFGARLSDAMDYVQKQQQQELLKRKEQQALELAKLQEDRARAQWKMQQDAFNGVGGPSIGGNATGGQQGNAPGSSSDLDRLERMAIAGVPGAKEALDIYKYKNTPQKLDAGSFQRNSVTGASEYIPNPEKGIGYGPSGMFMLPGSENLAKLAGQTAQAQEAAKAQNDLVTIPQDNGTTRTMPRSAAVNALSPTPQTNPTDVRGDGYFGGSRSAADAQSLLILQNELNKARQDPRSSPELIAGISREIARIVPQDNGTTRTMPRSAAVNELSPTPQQMALIQADIAQNGNPNPTINFRSQLPTLGETKVPLTPGQTSVDQAFAKDFNEFSANGGYTDVMKQLKQLGIASTNLGRNEGLTGPLVGMIPEKIRTITNPKAIDTKNMIEETVQRNLRSVLGAQFTQIEGENLIKRAFNPQLSDAENKARVDRLISQIGDAAKQKADAATYFEKNGTLAGWQGKLPSFSDFSPDGGDSAATKKTATLADIQETARKSGKSTAEVTKALRAQGFTIGGN